MSIKKISFLLSFFFFICILISYPFSLSAREKIEKIKNIYNKPVKYYNKVVTIKGIVHSYSEKGRLSDKVYLLQDSKTEKIQVHTKKGIPALEKNYVVNGKIERDEKARTFYLVELSRSVADKKAVVSTPAISLPKEEKKQQADRNRNLLLYVSYFLIFLLVIAFVILIKTIVDSINLKNELRNDGLAPSGKKEYRVLIRRSRNLTLYIFILFISVIYFLLLIVYPPISLRARINDDFSPKAVSPKDGQVAGLKDKLIWSSPVKDAEYILVISKSCNFDKTQEYIIKHTTKEKSFSLDNSELREDLKNSSSDAKVYFWAVVALKDKSKYPMKQSHYFVVKKD